MGRCLSPLGLDQCELCENIYANYLEFVYVCFKCHRTICYNCFTDDSVCSRCKNILDLERIVIK